MARVVRLDAKGRVRLFRIEVGISTSIHIKETLHEHELATDSPDPTFDEVAEREEALGIPLALIHHNFDDTTP